MTSIVAKPRKAVVITKAELSSFGVERTMIESLTDECPDFGAMCALRQLALQMVPPHTARRRLLTKEWKASTVNWAQNS